MSRKPFKCRLNVRLIWTFSTNAFSLFFAVGIVTLSVNTKANFYLILLFPHSCSGAKLEKWSWQYANENPLSCRKAVSILSANKRLFHKVKPSLWHSTASDLLHQDCVVVVSSDFTDSVSNIDQLLSEDLFPHLKPVGENTEKDVK